MKRAPLRLFFVLAAASLVACTAILGDFTVDPGASGDGGPGSSGGEGSVPPTPPPTDGSDDGPISCTAPEVLCGVVTGAKHCANVATAAEDCGQCGHSCGGGTCAGGKCQPFTIYTKAGTDASSDTIGPIAVGATDIFFVTNSDAHLNACSKKGCGALVPRQIVAMPFAINSVMVMGALNTVIFQSAPQNGSGTERPAVFACDTIAGCPALPTSFVSDGLGGFERRLDAVAGKVFVNSQNGGLEWSTCQASGAGCTAVTSLGTTLPASTKNTHGFSLDATNIYFIDSPTRTGTLAKCAQTDTACTPAALPAAGGPVTDVPVTAVFNGVLYWLKTGRDGFIEGKVLSCDLPACTTAKTLVGALDSPSELVVDASGAYWFSKGRKLQRCALPDCNGGARDLTDVLDAPHSVATDANGVFWAESYTVRALAK